MIPSMNLPAKSIKREELYEAVWCLVILPTALEMLSGQQQSSRPFPG